MKLFFDTPVLVAVIEENVLTHFRSVPLVAEDHRESLRALASAGHAGE